MRKITALFFLSAFLWSCSKSDSFLLKHLTQGPDSYFDYVFTSEVAERFSLHKQNALDLQAGVLAQGLEISRTGEVYLCTLHIYTDSSFDIYTPDGTRQYQKPVPAETAFVHTLNDEDQQIIFDLFDKQHGYALFRQDGGENFIATLNIEYVHKNYLPNISLVSVPVECELLQTEYQPASLWVQKNNATQAPVGIVASEKMPNTDSAYSFELSQKLLQRNAVVIGRIAEHNIQNLSQ